MKIFLDTGDLGEIKEVKDLDWIYGVTTNPTFFKKQGVKNTEEFMKLFHDICPNKELHIESMEGYEDFPEGVVAKVPFSMEGLKVIESFRRKGTKVNMHLVYSPNQALLASAAGAHYICVLMGRSDDMGVNSQELLSTMKCVIKDTELMAASIRHPRHVEEAAVVGADAITIPYSVLQKMMHHPLTEDGIIKFKEDDDSECNRPLFT